MLVAFFFETSQAYKLKVMNKYLTIVKAQGDRWRYYKAYLSGQPSGRIMDRAGRQLREAIPRLSQCRA